MQTEDLYIMNAYPIVAELDGKHGVYLVQQINSRKIYVRKDLKVYSRAVYDHVKQEPVANMPRILELVETDGVLTVIEEYFSGDTLQELLDTYGPMGEEAVLDIVLQLCAIVRQLHSAEPAIVHRDIKPSNIILSPDGVVKLLDINAARQYHQEESQDTRAIGTVGYAAPEQYGFQQSSIQTDIYAVGVLMNMLLTGQFPGKKLTDGKLRPVIERCIQLSPRDRYHSVAELENSLRRFCLTAPRENGEQFRYSWQKYLLPGMRSLRMPETIFVLALYAVLFRLTTAIQLQDVSPRELVINRIAATTMAALMVLFNGNYLDIRGRLPLTRSPRWWVRCIGIVIYNILIFVVVMSTLTALVD